MSFGEELLWRSRMAALLLPHTPFQKHRPSLKITNWEWISNNNAQKGEKMVVGEMCMKPLGSFKEIIPKDNFPNSAHEKNKKLRWDLLFLSYI